MTGRFSMEMILFAVEVSTPLNDVEMPEKSFHESTERGGHGAQENSYRL